MSTDLSPTERTTVRRGRDRALTDRDDLHALLAEAPVAHVGVVVGDHPVVLPVAFAVDPDGPDDGGTLYIHGSVAARWLTRAASKTVCVTVTELDGLVAARSGFHHSVNYRSAVVIGEARIVSEPAEKERALALTVDHLLPGRAATLRPASRKELAATAVLAVAMAEASMKRRTGDPVDEPEDVAAGTWAGVIPLRRVASAPVSAADSHDDVPADVLAVADALGPTWTRRRVTRLRAMTQRTLVLLKPDAVRRGLVGEVLGRYEAKGLSIVALEQRTIDAEQADAHYSEHVERDFYPPLRAFVTSGPLVALVLEGDEAVEVVRALNGATDGRKAAPGTIRGDLSVSNRENLVHGSDSPESAEREIGLWFPTL